MAALDQIKTIFVLMLENRSFDHVLGYLSLPPWNRADVDGLRNDPAWVAQFTNVDNGVGTPPFPYADPYSLPPKFDPPHEFENVIANLGTPNAGIYPMNGFVSAIPKKVTADPAVRRLVMSYFTPREVPIAHFLAENFAICDRWFCSLPAGTQPNRLMSMAGESKIKNNQVPLPSQALVYDWLTERGISWRVYHQGIPFFALMPKWIPRILANDHFRPFDRLQADLANTPPSQIPQVIFLEPTYGDSPHVGRSTDDHAPSGVADGQEFLMQAYNAVTVSPTVWKRSALIVTYDEHGGFFDHVSPPLVPTNPPPGANYSPMESLGVRVPAYVISPYVRARSVNHTQLDHTSILKLFGEKFGGGSYSPSVDARDVASVSAVLDDSQPILVPPAIPPLDAYFAARPPPPVGVTAPPPTTALQAAFTGALTDMKQNGADGTHAKFGALLA